jgi:4-amino-4-deoxy-L-arabinose transferase-like glycosyltransferase
VTAPRWYRLAVPSLLAFALAVGIWNAATYKWSMGYDASNHYFYAIHLVRDGYIESSGKGEYYSPPVFYAIGGAAWWVGSHLGVGDPIRVALGLNALFGLATAVLVLALVRELWPRRLALHLAALAFIVLLPVRVKLTAMFHPEPLDLLLATAGLYLGTRMLARNAYSTRLAVGTGAAFGVGVLVRQFSAYSAAAVGLAFLVAGRRDALRALGVIVAVAVAIATPWYVRQALVYTNPVFAQPATVPKPFLERRPASFYVGTGLPEILTAPWRPSFRNEAIPTTYTELWGDYFGAYRWDAIGRPDAGARRELQVQSFAGILPTLLAVVGLVALLAASLRRRDPARLAVALVPLCGFVGFAYFTIAYPTPDGDVIKASYMLTTASAWAVCFAYAVDLVARRRAVAPALLAALAACGLAVLPFLFF